VVLESCAIFTLSMDNVYCVLSSCIGAGFFLDTKGGTAEADWMPRGDLLAPLLPTLREGEFRWGDLGEEVGEDGLESVLLSPDKCK